MKINNNIKLNKEHILILIIFFLMGLASNISQSVIFREFLVIFYGNELILGVILFFWLFAITVGAMVYNPLSKKINDKKRFFFNLVFVFSLLPFLLIPFIRLSRSFSGTPYGHFVPFVSMAWISFLGIFPPGFLIGLTFPLGCKILDSKTAVAKVYVFESIGSLFGGVVFSFLLIRLFSTPVIAAIILSAFSITIIIHHILCETGMKKLKKALVIIVLVLTLLSLVAAPVLEKKTVLARWRTLIKDLPLISNVDSPYQNLALTKQMDQYSVFYNGVYGFAFPDDYEEAVAAHHILTQHPNPKDVLIIGEVTPGFMKECLKQPVETLTVSYLDPTLYKMMEPVLSEENRKVLKDPRVIHQVADGRFFIKTTGKKFDMVFLNLPDPSTAFMNRFYTQDFFREVKKALKPSGVLGLNITSSENYLGAQILDYNTAIYRSLKSVFPNISISPGTYTYFFASQDPNASSDDHRVLFERYNKRKISGETTFTPYLFETLYEKERIDFKRKMFEKKTNGRLNTDLSPVAYLYNLKLWDRYSSSHLSGILTFLEEKGLPFWLKILAGFIVVAFILILIIKPQKQKLSKACSLFAVFSSGLCAMGLSVILIYSYQSLYGYLFQRIGFLIALFMLGLSIGGSIIHYLIKKKKATLALLIAIQILICILCLSLPSVLKLFDNMSPIFQPLFFSLMVLTGILTGHILPLSAHLVNQWGTELGKSASYTMASDHLGGCIGAILIGAFFVPLMGLSHCAFFLAALQGVSLVLWGVGKLGVR